jgi:CubicO group peptidase (beta-lactamase class C family)
MDNTAKLHIDGYVDPGFASVKRLFERDLGTLAERNAQLCIYVGDELVVDLWGSAIGDTQFNADSLVNVFSSGKSLEAIAIAYLVGQGLLNYDDKIAIHWPEFANAGKEHLTVADLMRHEAGLASLSVSLKPEDLWPENIKQNKVGEILENHATFFKPDSPREYHAVTRGWVVNELFRRVDQSGRTIGEFLEQELRAPLDADVMVGVPESELARRSPVKLVPFGYHLKQSFRPIFMGRRVKDNFFQTSAKLLPLLPRVRKRNSNPDARAPFVGMDRIEFFNEDSIARGETPSANAHCSARGLARLAAMLANRGKFNGQEVLPESAWHAMHDNPVVRQMAFETIFTQGGVAKFGDSRASRLERAANLGREGFYGWMGLGGSIFQWHPERKIGFAYVPTSLHAIDVVNERGKTFQKEALRCT